ncbi:DUF4190 domain-containing protein [Micromonospora echinospora]
MRYLLSEYVNPWVCGRIAFRPAVADPAKPFQRLSDWRARSGAFVVMWLSVPYLGVSGVVDDLLSNSSYNLAAGAFYTIAVVSAYWVVAQPLPQDKAYQVRSSLQRAGLSFVVTIALGLAVRTEVFTVPGIGWLLAIWSVIFALSMMWHCLRWVFGASDAHPLLGPIVTTMTAFTALAIDQILDTGGDKRPANLQTLIDMGALASVCLLAAIEFFYISYKLGKEPSSLPLRDPLSVHTPRRPKHLGYGLPHPPERPTHRHRHSPPVHVGPDAPMNKLAIFGAAGVTICWPASLVLGIWALRQIARTGERGRWLAILAVASSAATMLTICMATAYVK